MLNIQYFDYFFYNLAQHLSQNSFGVLSVRNRERIRNIQSVAPIVCSYVVGISIWYYYIES